jgi:Tol biopolymer transport system component/DNA-binding winged helix-turn-helix (wHTH) protein
VTLRLRGGYTARVQTSPKASEVFRFGIFELDCRSGELRKRGIRVHLQDQPLQILIMLIERPGELVTREEIQTRLWPSGTIVEFEHSIGTAIKKLRQALGDDAGTPRYVETLPRRGYRFIAPVENSAPHPPLAVEPLATVPAPEGRRSWRIWAAAIALVMVAGLYALFLYVRLEPRAGVPRMLTRLTFDNGLQFGPTWSPDGRFIAYSSDRDGKFDIWVQQVGAVKPVKITSRPGHNWQPDWSPDGNSIVFRSEGEGGGLFIVPALGGAERKISSFGYYPKWSPDGRLILFRNTFLSWLSKLYVAGLDGGSPREILTDFLKRSQIAQRVVGWYPHSNRISIWGDTMNGSGFWTVSLDGTHPVKSEATASVADVLSKFWGKYAVLRTTQFVWQPSGRAIYFNGKWDGVENIWKIRVDPSTMRFFALERLTAGPGPDTDLAISPDGKTLAYAARSEQVRVWSYSFDANSGRLLGGGTAATPPGVEAWRADISPDGQKLAYVMKRAGEYELWQTALPDGDSTLLLRGSGVPLGPRWSPDSQRLGYGGGSSSTALTNVLLSAGGGSADPVTSASFRGYVEDWSRDGHWLVANRGGEDPLSSTEHCIVLLPLSAAPTADTKARVVTCGNSEGLYRGIYEIRLSPNGRWIVFEAVEGGLRPGGAANAILYVVPVSGGSWIRITDGQSWDDKPRWSPDGKTIFFISSRTGLLNVWGIRFDPESGRPQDQPFQVTSFGSPKLMVADDLDWQSLSLSQDRLVFSMKESSGSLWALHDVDK